MDAVGPNTSSEEVTVSMVSVAASFVVESPCLLGIVEGVKSISSSACGDEVPRVPGIEVGIFAVTEAVALSFPNDVVKPLGFSDLASDTPIVTLIVVGILRVGTAAERWCPAVIVEASGDIAVKRCVLVVARTVEVSCPGIVEASDVVSIESSVLVVGATAEVSCPGIVEKSDVVSVERSVYIVGATVEVSRLSRVEASGVCVEGSGPVLGECVEVSSPGIVDASDDVEGSLVVVGAGVEVSPSGIVEASYVAGVEGNVVVYGATVEVSCPGIVEASDVAGVEDNVVVVWTVLDVSGSGVVVAASVVSVVKDGAVVVSSSHRDIHCMCVLSSEVINIRNGVLLKTVKQVDCCLVIFVFFSNISFLLFTFFKKLAF